jgi:hypothetical protein
MCSSSKPNFRAKYKGTELFLAFAMPPFFYSKYVGTFSLHYTLRQAQGEDRLSPYAEPVEALSTKITHVLILAILFGAFSFLQSCTGILKESDSHQGLQPSEFGRKFPKDSLVADLDFFLKTYKEVHIDPYQNISENLVRTLRDSLVHSLPDSLTSSEFYPMCARFVAEFGDGHTVIMPPLDQWAHFRNHGGLAFPFAVSVSLQDGITVSKNYSSDATIPSGSRIIAINGHSVDSLLKTWIALQSGEKQSFRAASIAQTFRVHLWLSKILSPYTIEFELPQKRSVSTVQGVTSAAISRQDSLDAKTSNISNYIYKRFRSTDGDIAYIDFRSMNDLPAFEDFLKTTFSDIKANPVKGLIIDMRKNSGGNSELGNKLFSYITEKPYRMTARKEWRMSKQYKEYAKAKLPEWLHWAITPISWFNSTARTMFQTPDGQVAIIEYNAEKVEKQNSLQYAGKICFLMGNYTFSSAMMTVNAVKDFQLATLIGEETGGIPNAFGEQYAFDMPHTRLQCGISAALFVRANGDRRDKRGVQPDIEVQQGDEDTRNKRDTALEYAKQWTKK